MIPNSVIKIETRKFPILEGEVEEIINDQMYGKALCRYLKSQLIKSNVKAKDYFAEDWGWWLEVEDDGFEMGLCIYSDPDAQGHPEAYVIMPSVHSEKIWSWSKFRKVDVSRQVLRIIENVVSIFSKDKEISVVTTHSDFPF